MAQDEERDDNGKPNGNSAEGVPLVHKVEFPPTRNDFAIIGSGLYEFFVHDAPLNQFKSQRRRQKGLLGLKFVFPILDWITTYTRRMLLADFVAKCTIASLAIPQDLGYARLAGVPPANGLYSSFVPPLDYSVFGRSRDIAIGPVAVLSLLLGTLLKQEISPTDNPAFTTTFFCAFFQTGLGVFRLVFVTEFLSHATIVGFMAGAAVTTALQPLKGLLDITHPTSETDFISVMKSVFGHIDEMVTVNMHLQWNWRSTVIGLAFLGFLIATKILGQKKKKLFWMSAIAPQTSVILSTLFVFLTRVDKHGVKIVGHIKKGVDPVSAHQFFLSGSLAAAGPKIGLIASLIVLTEGVAIRQAFAALRDYHIDGNKDMIAFGVMNLCGSVTSCYIASGSFSRSAVKYQAGVYTARSNVIMSILVLITLLVLTPLFKYTPNTILSAIIISAVPSLIDLRAAWLVWKIDKFGFLAYLGALVGIFFVSIEIGLLVAVCFSFVKILYNVPRPHTARLDTVVTNVYRNVTQYRNAALVPGVLAIRVDAAIYFSNFNHIHDKILHYLEETQKLAETGGARIQYLIVDSTPVTNIDTSGIIAFEDLEKTLKQKNIQLAFANPGALVISKLDDSKFLVHLGSEWLFFTMSEAIQVCAMLLNQAAAERQV